MNETSISSGRECTTSTADELQKVEHRQWLLRRTIKIKGVEEHHRQEEVGNLVEGLVEEVQEAGVFMESFKRRNKMRFALGVAKSITGAGNALTKKQSVHTVERQVISRKHAIINRREYLDKLE